MKKLRKILAWACYLSIMCLTISGLIVVLWEYPDTSFLVELVKISVLACMFFAIALLGVGLYEDFN